MTPNYTVNAIESRVAFCQRISDRLSGEGFGVIVQPGDHLVDDAGADSLLVLDYVLLLQELGLKIDLNAFDTTLLNTDVAYDAWLCQMAGPTQAQPPHVHPPGGHPPHAESRRAEPWQPHPELIRTPQAQPRYIQPQQEKA